MIEGKGPTDFNDQPADASALACQIDQDLAAMSPAKQPTITDDTAKLFKGYNPLVDYEPPPLPKDVDRWQDLFEENQNRDPKGSVRNLALVLTYDEQWRGVLAYNELSYKIVKRSQPPLPFSKCGEWDDTDSAGLRIWCAEHFSFTPNHTDITDALVSISRGNSYHPVREYLEPLKWDGEPRLEVWLKNALGCTDHDDYLALVGKRFLIAAVARVIKPGCKVDNVLILEGKQGKGKSTTVRILFGDEFFSDAQLPIGDKEAYQVIQGKWGFEIAELDSFNKADTTTLKQFFSQQEDRFRASYGRHVKDWPRQTLFMGTTNNDVYLRDYTGNRRFWPVYSASIDKDWVRDNRDQLWAEAMHFYRAGHKWWVDEVDDEFGLVQDAQDDRLQRDPWEDFISRYIDRTSKPSYTSAELLESAIELLPGQIQQAHNNRLAPIMKALGWKSKRVDVPTLAGEKRRQRRAWVLVEQESLRSEVPL